MRESRDTYIANSHQRCLNEYQLNPYNYSAPKKKLSKSMLEQKKSEIEDIISVARKFMTKLISDLAGTAVLIVITDHEGYILEMYGDEAIKGQVESLGLTTGIKLQEDEVGTNGIEMALEMGEPVQLIGTDHFFSYLHESACFSVPFFSSGKIRGTISVMMGVGHASAFHLGLLRSAADSIEREVKVKKQNKRLSVLNQVLIENSRNGIIMTNDAGRIVEINPYAETTLGFKREDIINCPITELMVIGQYMGNVLRSRKKYENIEISISKKIFLFDSFPIYDESDHQIIGVFAQFRDITERIELERQLMISEKLSAIGKIGAGLAHEIRNPLTSIIGLLDLLRRNLKTDDHKQNEYFRIVFSELDRIKNLVQQFVMMAKPEQKEIVISSVGIHELIEDILTLMETEWIIKNIQIHYQAFYKDKINIDKDKLKQVFLNILQNAFDAVDFNGNISIVIRQSQHDNGIEIIISDDGMGMDKDTLEKLSTPFHSTKKDGLGLGLSMSYNMIELHKGRIKVESEKGKGTTFAIWLPLS